MCDFLSPLVIVHYVDPELYVVAREDFPGRALLPAPTEALVIDEGPITTLCVLQVKLREKTQKIIIMAIGKKTFVDLWCHPI